MEFANKKVLVTGGSRSIGRQIALDFAEQGAQVLIGYTQNKTQADETVKSLNQKNTQAQSKAICADFSDADQIATFANEAIAYLGHIDILVNNAGIIFRETLLDLSFTQMQQIFQINTIAPLYLSQLCAKDMIANDIKGSMINISSMASIKTSAYGIAYAASKAALNKWTKNAALDLSAYGIRVNAVSPGIIGTGMNENQARLAPEAWHKRTKDIPLQRPGTPDDIASMVLYLASKKASWVTGKVIEVDGG